MKNIVVAIILSLVCSTFALDEHFSPVLFFKHKDNKKVFEKSVISSTSQVDQREFERRFDSFDKDQRIIFFVVPDLSPEDFSAKNADNTRAFQNTANEANIVEYIPFVENAVDNKMTNGKNVAFTSVSTINELEPEPSNDKKHIVVRLPGYHVSELKFHWLARIDRAMHGILQLEKYKDALFILSSEINSRLQEQEHSRKIRAAGVAKPYILRTPHVLVYATDFMPDPKKGHQDDTPVKITSITSSLNNNTINVQFQSAFPLILVFNLDPSNNYWTLNASQSTVKNQLLQLSTVVGAPQEFSYSCSSGVYFKVEDDNINGVYFVGFQIQFNFNSSSTQNIDKFADSYDCIGFISIPIWAGLFITFLLLGIVSTGISYIMDIRSMDRFDDPKGKTITVTASE